MRQRIFRLLLSASFERSSSLASSQVLHSRKIATCWNTWKTPESDQRSQTEKRFANRENTDRAGLNFPQADFSVVKHFYSIAVLRPLRNGIGKYWATLTRALLRDILALPLACH